MVSLTEQVFSINSKDSFSGQAETQYRLLSDVSTNFNEEEKKKTFSVLDTFSLLMVSFLR